MRRTFFWFVSGIKFFKLSRLYCEQVTDNRPFAASHSSGTKPPCWTPLGHGKQKASIILNGNFLRLSCPSATFALQHCGFVPREWQATKGLFRLPSYDVFKSPFHDSNEHFRGYQAPAFTLYKKIVLSFRLAFFVMKVHVNNSCIRKIHKQRNINCEKYVRYYF